MERNEVRATGCRKVAAALFLFVLGILCLTATISIYGQEFEHVHKGFDLYAERVPGGSVVEMYVEKDLPESIAFPLPSGTYNIYITTPADTALATDYMRFSASAKNVQVNQGTVINITGGTTPQALILFDTTGVIDPVISVEYKGHGYAWQMWKKQGYYYAYVDANLDWAIGDYRFRPKPGETWKLTDVVVNYTPDNAMPGPVVEPEPDPIAPNPITIEAETWDDCTCPPIRGSVTGTPGVGGTGAGSWVKYSGINLTGMKSIELVQSSVNTGRIMEIRIDAPNGQIIGTYAGTSTGSWETYQTFSTAISPVEGVHDVYFVFLQHAVMDIDKFTLRPE